jgi:hypothetical protein
MDLKENMQKYGVLVVGLMIGGGFAFGGIAQYAGLTDSGGSGNQGENTFNASLPAENFAEQPLDRGIREQLGTAARNGVVIVNAYYENESQREQVLRLREIPGRFNDNVYVRAVNASNGGTVYFNYEQQVDSHPFVVVYGASRSYSSQPVESSEPDRIASEICSAVGSISRFPSECV